MMHNFGINKIYIVANSVADRCVSDIIDKTSWWLMQQERINRIIENVHRLILFHKNWWITRVTLN